MKKIVMMAVAALMATTANAQFEKGTWSLQPYAGGVISSVSNVEPLSIGSEQNLEKKK